MSTLVVNAWVEALEEAWMLAKGERGNELRGRYVKRFDDRGLHPLSECWGRIHGLEAACPWLADIRSLGESACEPVFLRREAAREAEREFAEAIAGGQDVWARRAA